MANPICTQCNRRQTTSGNNICRWCRNDNTTEQQISNGIPTMFKWHTYFSRDSSVPGHYRACYTQAENLYYQLCRHNWQRKETTPYSDEYHTAYLFTAPDNNDIIKVSIRAKCPNNFFDEPCLAHHMASHPRA